MNDLVRVAARLAVVLAVAGASACAGRSDRREGPTAGSEVLAFEATAYSIEGTTASGSKAREGVCAADPDVLPIGTRIRVHDAGPYSGECLVADTGRTIVGREIDIYVARDGEAKRFGRREVGVEVLE